MSDAYAAIERLFCGGAARYAHNLRDSLRYAQPLSLAVSDSFRCLRDDTASSPPRSRSGGDASHQHRRRRKEVPVLHHRHRRAIQRDICESEPSRRQHITVQSRSHPQRCNSDVDGRASTGAARQSRMKHAAHQRRRRDDCCEREGRQVRLERRSEASVAGILVTPRTTATVPSAHARHQHQYRCLRQHLQQHQDHDQDQRQWRCHQCETLEQRQWRTRAASAASGANRTNGRATVMVTVTPPRSTVFLPSTCTETHEHSRLQRVLETGCAGPVDDHLGGRGTLHTAKRLNCTPHSQQHTAPR
jgi:hypothetical protein